MLGSGMSETKWQNTERQFATNLKKHLQNKHKKEFEESDRRESQGS